MRRPRSLSIVSGRTRLEGSKDDVCDQQGTTRLASPGVRPGRRPRRDSRAHRLRRLDHERGHDQRVGFEEPRRVCPEDGDVLITDGPYAEGKEYLGGFTIVRAPDLDSALEWGRRLARVVTLPIEVRPFADEAGD